ncbi:3020_t:CDS:2 [Paraglomus occultum]|uniref:Signal peptidase complex catalytic subunit SEC11 n=1 Tax=Paraglomus occultum TaxID=144539 RepID=A0A9N8YY57_9GLOM|nr:3020_t:CDS:2 [Paraglomus occultum]
MQAVKQLVVVLLSFFTIFASALIAWKSLGTYMKTLTPIIIVFSESMEPAFHRGDLLLISTPDEPIQVGDVIAYRVKGNPMPIVHRVIKIHENKQLDSAYILTKGDNIDFNDRSLYYTDQLWVKREDVIGTVRGFIPYIGYIAIAMNEYPGLRWILVLAMGFCAVVYREQL